ncbi:MAG: hypothetical protein J6B88_04850 [Clostridia bacterium]|nr:hypothetical protein [Clostridia bacterium]
MKLKIKAFLKRIIPEKIQKTSMFKMVARYKYTAVATVALLICLSIVMTTIAFGTADDNYLAADSSSTIASSEISSLVSEESSSSEAESEISSEESSSSKKNTTSSKKSGTSKKPAKTSSKNSTISVSKPALKGDYKYNTNLNIEDNVFMDSLIYTGYNMKKHRADGKMWQYVLAKYKRGYGWLSDITYAGGSTGLETKNGKPDIGYFERNGLVCASFATYVYFNYLPNVAGIDTSSLPRPENTKLADSWYKAVQQWVKKGYSRTIDFTAKKDSSNYIVFRPKEEIPIGSIIIFRPYSSNQKVGSHVVVYAGYKNGFHWVYHVGTKNGPEMCAVERMLYGPEPQWPLMVVTTPSNIRMAAMLEVELKDDEGKAISGVEFSIKNTKTGAVTKLGKTDKNGKIAKECLNYGEYTLVQASVPKGYTAKTTTTKINLTTKNNSKNTVKVVNAKNKPPVTSTPSSPVSSETSSEGESSKNEQVTSEASDSSN